MTGAGRGRGRADLRARTRVAIVALTAAASVAQACSDGSASTDARATTSSAPTTTTTAAPPTTLAPVATTAAPRGAGAPYTVWLLRDGRLSPGEQRTSVGDDTPRESVEALIAGRTEAEDALGLQTGVSSAVTIQSWEQEGTTVIVGFNRAFETAQTRPQVAQVVWTLTQFDGIDAVQFLIDGRTNGATGVPPMDRFEVDEVAPPVLVDAPLPATVLGDATDLTVTGTTAPGATVGWRLEDGGGATLAAGGPDEVAPEPGPDTRTAWRTEIPLPPGTTGTIRLVVFDASDGLEVYPQVIPLTLGAPPPGP